MIRAAGCLALAVAVLSSAARAAPVFWPGALEQEGRALVSAPDPERVDAIALLVGRFGVAAATPWLRPLLAAGPPAARLYAARLLIRSGDAAARTIVLGWLTSPRAQPSERALAIDALSWSPAAEDLRPTFEQAARDRDALTRTEALDALARLDGAAPRRISPSLPVFLAALDDADREVRFRAVRLVTRAAEIHDPDLVRAAPLLLERLDDSDRQVRVAALAALARLRDPRTVPALVRIAGGEPTDLQVVAIDALGWPGNDAAVAPLSDLLRRRLADEAGRHAARALGSIATPAALRALVDALRLPPVPDDVERAIAAAGPPAVPWLAREVTGANLATAARAIGLLGRTGDARALAPLALAARKRGPLVLAAVEAIGRLGDPAAVPILAEACESPEPEVRQAALAGLTTVGAPEAVAVLERGLADGDPGVRAAAAELAGRLAGKGIGGGEMERATGRILDALADPAREVRLASARALLSLGETGRADRVAAALASLGRSAKLARDPQERDAIGEALAALVRDDDAARIDAAFLAAPDVRLFGAALLAAHARSPIADRRIVQRLIVALDGDTATATAAAGALGAARLSGDDVAAIARAAAGAEPSVRARLTPAAAGQESVAVRLVDTAGLPLAGRWVRVGGPALWISVRSDGTGQIRVTRPRSGDVLLAPLP